MLLLLTFICSMFASLTFGCWGTAGQQQSRMILLQTSGNAAKKQSPPHAARLQEVTVHLIPAGLVLFCPLGGLASYTCC